MKVDRRKTVWLLLASLAAAAVLFVLLFDRYSYDDYHERSCGADTVALDVRLSGSFTPARPQVRSSPYRLWIGGLDEAGEPVVLQDLRLVSQASGATLELGGIRRFEGEAAGHAAPAAVYLAEPLRLAYDDYLLQGTIVADRDGRSHSTAFTCALDRHPWSEWRNPRWDALMGI
ncbi:hypothetical protein [Stenotrophomonas sp. 24(2023)]|uniref:hypothetical protein n=1 Tax=Stenotrophomonas sp. 24(2023) TaxID=3068324 RepID=UPI0027E1A447|nr:hypothetical protein [Stenotrophomonas sp. 24(2023)]WMJ68357.1 hypothetical protein Q9R17_14280 [Stenotrophomonas sp. 24(2023)]